MKHSLKSLSLLLILVLCASPVLAQDRFGLWTEAGLDKSLSKKFSFNASLGYRANDNLRSSSRFDAGIGLGYKPIKGLKIGVGYVAIEQHTLREVTTHFNDRGNWNGFNVNHQYWRWKNRLFADVTGKLSVGRLTFGLRERYQATIYNARHMKRDKYRGVVTEDYADQKIYGEYEGTGRWYAFDETTDVYKKAKTKHFLRSRVSVDWNIRHCPVDPFASFELSNNLSHGFSIDKRRWTLGADWKLSKKHTVSAAYVYTNGTDDDDEGNLHALSLSYKFKF